MSFSDSVKEKFQEPAKDHPEQVEQFSDQGQAKADGAIGEP